MSAVGIKGLCIVARSYWFWTKQPGPDHETEMKIVDNIRALQKDRSLS